MRVWAVGGGGTGRAHEGYGELEIISEELGCPADEEGIVGKWRFYANNLMGGHGNTGRRRGHE